MKSLIPLFLCLMFILGAGCDPVADVNLSPTSDVPEITKESLVDETAEGAVILYWAEGCSHCESVKTKISNARINDKITIVQKEAYNNDANYKEFFTRMKYCQVPEYQIGVPMLWDGEDCYLGVEDIMSALADKLRINN